MRFFLSVLTALFTFSSVVSAQPEGKWTTYVNANCITGIAFRSDLLWLATSGGVMCRNTVTGSHHQYTTQDGLPSNGVARIAAGPDGTAWAGTYWGLWRLEDGSWKKIPHTVTAPHEEIRSLAIAPDGSVWTGMNSGVSRYDGFTWTDYTVEDGLPTGPVQSIVFDQNGNPWCGIAGRVWRLEGGRWRGEPVYDEEGKEILLGLLASDSQGAVWGTTGKGLYYREDARWVASVTLNIPDNRFIETLASAPDGGLWGGLDRGSIFRFSGGQLEMYALPDSMRDSVILSLAVHPDGAVWVGTMYGLLRFDGRSWQPWLTDNTLPFPQVSSITKASDGSLWFGTGGGISRYDGTAWRQYGGRERFPYSESPHPLVFAPNGDLWFGTDNGIYRFDGSTWTDYSGEVRDSMTQAPYLPYISIGPDGIVWVEHLQGWLCRFDGMSWSTIREENGLPIPHTLPLASGLDGTLWCSGSDAVYSYDGHLWKTWTAEDGLEISRSPVQKIVAGPDGVMWCSTPGGAARFDGVRWETYASCDSLKTAAISSFAPGKDGSLWFGADNGAYWFDRSTWRHFTTADGLADNRVTSVILDDDGSVWFGTVQGVSRFTPDANTIVSDRSVYPASLPVTIHPNPFNPSTAISFTLPVSGRMSLSIYSITGQKVRELISAPLPAGAHTVRWDGKDSSGKPVSSGVYLSQLVMGGRTSTGKLMLLR